jgi:uncharacterized phage infection (PIP) family protein YhgE
MKTTSRIVAGFTVAALLIPLAGCVSGNYQKGANTAAGLSTSGDKIVAGKGKIEATLAALNDLVDNPQGDLVAKFKQLNAGVSQLQSAANEVGATVRNMSKAGDEYFKGWDEQLAQIRNEDLKKSSVERRANVQKEFTDAKRGYMEFETALKPFMSDLRDVQTMLGTDLTAGGVSVIKSAAVKANKDAEPLKNSLDHLATQFRELSAAMASSTPVPSRATAAK